MSYLIKRTSKNQITLPSKVMKDYPQVEYFELTVSDGQLVLTPANLYRPSEALLDMRRQSQAQGLTEKDALEAVKWARGKNKKK